MPVQKVCLLFILFFFVMLSASQSILAQSTAFSYQGKLLDGGNPADGNYDLQFKLFDTATVGTGTQQGSTVTVSNVTVTAGMFTVQLDFGAAVFPGANRFLEIAVKQTGASTFLTLSPRQGVAAIPYAIHTQNADSLSVACLSCITSSQIQSVQGSQVTGAIAGNQINGAIPVASVPAGSANYIQNNTSQQAATNFNISGIGAANILDAATQFNLSGSRILSNAGLQNLFAGNGAGTFNTGSGNSFFGFNAGIHNTGACCNAFFGSEAGENNTGPGNSFYGSGAGRSNTTANENSFFGAFAGFSTTTGALNSFFGYTAGNSNTTGGSNSFFGQFAGFNNTTGSNNTFIGVGAGNPNTATQVSNSVAIGTGATVSTSNTIMLGTSSQTTRLPGLLSVGGQPGFNPILEIANSTNGGAVIANNFYIRQFTEPASSANLCWRVSTIGVPAMVVTTCSSSLRYKTALQPFSGGIGVILRLKPTTFNWTATGERDVGLLAEEVAEVEPLFTFKNSKGEIEGIKYANLSVLFINAFKEQQAQINEQQKQIDRQQREIEMLKKRQLDLEILKKLVCASQPHAAACQLK